MRAIMALFIVLAVALVFVGTSTAAPGGEVKASPLFKHSLEESIAKLEGKAPQVTAPNEAEPMPTGRPGCPKPNALPTGDPETCYDSCSGTCFATCGGPYTCGGSTCGTETCTSTCANTCSGPTCGDTCTGTSCENYCLDGYVKHPAGSTNWNGWSNRLVKIVAAYQNPVNFGTNGYYFMPDVGNATKTLEASAQYPSGITAYGQKYVPHLSNPGTYQYDMSTNYH